MSWNREQVYSNRNSNRSLSNKEDLNVKVSSSNVSVSSCLDDIEGMTLKNNEVWKWLKLNNWNENSINSHIILRTYINATLHYQFF